MEIDKRTRFQRLWNQLVTWWKSLREEEYGVIDFSTPWESNMWEIIVPQGTVIISYGGVVLQTTETIRIKASWFDRLKAFIWKFFGSQFYMHTKVKVERVYGTTMGNLTGVYS